MDDFPDYEAAARTLTEFPFDDENDYVQDQARRKAFLAVNAALGDEPLYQEVRTGDKSMGIMAVCPLWPKEET